METTINRPEHCAHCGAQLPEISRHDFCSKCLLQGLLGTPEEDEPEEVISLSRKIVLPPKKSVNDSGLNQEIGPYTLIEMVAEGGMGEVFIAEQHEPVHRLVALKIVKLGLDSREVLRRFEAERQALAMLDHPSITRVFDAGTAPSGRPYFVMELVDGVPITNYCDAHRFSPRQRLELFVKVCDAIQHAHQRGIIHRDLKPSNILVEEIDGFATPKVIDFGIAKAVGVELTERTMETQLGDLLGTPQYMSPEQALGKTNEIDTRSDIYSLGVILYELLTGSPPISNREIFEAGIMGIGKLLMELEPERPSTRLHSLGKDATIVAECRQTDPTRLEKSLRRELDWVALKCLEKERDRRYESASDLARDLERHLGNEMVVARPPDLTYRIRKYTSRHKIEIVASSIVMLTLIAGIIASMMFAFQAYEQREEAKLAQSQERLGREAMTALNLAHSAPADGLRKLYHLNDRNQPQGIVAEWNSITVGTEPSASIQSALAQAIELSRETARFSFPGHGSAQAMAMDQSGEKVAISLYYGAGKSATQVQVVDLKTGEFRVIDTEFQARCRSLDFLGDGRRLAAGFDNGVIALIPLDGGTIKAFDSHPRATVSGMAYAGKARILASFGTEGFCRRWTEQGVEFGIPAPTGPGTFEEIAFSEDGDLAVLRMSPIAHAPALVLIEWPPSGTPVVTRVPLGKSGATSVLIRSDGGLVITGHVNGSVEFRDRTGQVTTVPLAAHRAPIESLALLPGEKLLATGIRTSNTKVAEKSSIRIWRTDTGRPASPDLIGHNGNILGLAPAFGGKYLVSMGADKTCRVWNLLGLQVVPPIAVDIAAEALQFIDSGKLILTIRTDGLLELWDWRERRRIRSIRTTTNSKPVSLHVSASEKYLTIRFKDADELELFHLPELKRGPLINPLGGGVAATEFHPAAEKLYGVTAHGGIWAATEKAHWIPEKIGQISTWGGSWGTSFLKWLEPENALLIGGHAGPTLIVEESGEIHDQFKFDSLGTIQTMVAWPDLEKGHSWFASLGLSASELNLVPIEQGKFGSPLSRETFPVNIQGEDIAVSPVSGYIGAGGVNGLFVITDRNLNVIVPPFYPHDARFEAVAAHPTLPIFATSGRDRTIRFWAAGQDAFLQLAEERQSPKLARTEGFSFVPRKSRVNTTAKGVAFEAAGVTIPAHPDWKPIQPAIVRGAYDSVLKSVGDQYRRITPHRAWFSPRTGKAGRISNRDFVVYAEAEEGANPESFARRLGFYAGIAIGDWSRSLAPAIIYEKKSTRMDWDEKASVLTYSAALTLGEGGQANLQIHWVVANGSVVGIGAFAKAGNPESEAFLRQVSEMAHSSIIREENRLSKERLDEFREILNLQWKQIQKSAGFKDEYDEATSLWNGSRNSPKGLDHANRALQFATQQESINKGLWQESAWRIKKIYAMARVGHSTALVGNGEEGRTLARDAVEQMRLEVEQARNPGNYRAVAKVLSLYRDVLRQLKHPLEEQIQLQEEAIDMIGRARQLSTNRVFIVELASAHRTAASLARQAKQYDKSLEHSLEAERIFLEEYHPDASPVQQRWRDLYDIYNHRSDSYRDQKNFPKSIEAGLKSIDALRKHSEIRPNQVFLRVMTANQLWKVANLHRSANQGKADDLSREYAKQSIEILESLRKDGKLNDQQIKEKQGKELQVESWK